jgi:hypothetical protein
MPPARSQHSIVDKDIRGISVKLGAQHGRERLYRKLLAMHRDAHLGKAFS